jgi:uncharacterized protein (TIGR02266 family)
MKKRDKDQETSCVKLPVVTTPAHKGKALELDSEHETITLVGTSGEPLGTVTWEARIEYIRASTERNRPAESRTHPRISLLIRVQYRTAAGQQFEGRASGIGGGGMFIEHAAPLPVETEMTIRFALPGRPSQWLEAKGIVAWICPKADQYMFSPGMGVRFMGISTHTRERVLELVASLKRIAEGKK